MRTLLIIGGCVGLVGLGVLFRWMWEGLRRDAEDKQEENDW